MNHNLTGSHLALLSHLVFKERTSNTVDHRMGNDHPDQLELREILAELRVMTDESFDNE